MKSNNLKTFISKFNLLFFVLFVACSTSTNEVTHLKRNVDSQPVSNIKRMALSIDSINNIYSSSLNKTSRVSPNRDGGNDFIYSVWHADTEGFDDGVKNAPNDSILNSWNANNPPYDPTISNTTPSNYYDSQDFGIWEAGHQSLKEAFQQINNWINSWWCTVWGVIPDEDMWDDPYGVCPQNPIYTETAGNLPSTYIGLDAGVHHNAIINEYFSNTTDFISWADETSDEDIISGVIEASENLNYIPSCLDIEDFLQTWMEDMEYLQPTANYDAEIDIIDECLETMSGLQSRYWADYITDVAEVVDGYVAGNPILYTNSGMLINGALSVFYHSCCLWRTNVPDPWLTGGPILIYDSDFDKISTYLYSGDKLTALKYLVNQGTDVIITPKAYNERIERLFIFEELNEGTYDSFVSDYIYTSGGNYFIDFALPSSITIEGDNLQIPYGTYPVSFNSDYSICSILIAQ